MGSVARFRAWNLLRHPSLADVYVPSPVIPIDGQADCVHLQGDEEKDQHADRQVEQSHRCGCVCGCVWAWFPGTIKTIRL